MEPTPKILILYSEYERFIRLEEELRSLRIELKKKSAPETVQDEGDKTEGMSGSGCPEEGTFSLPLPLKVDEIPDKSISGLSVVQKTDALPPDQKVESPDRAPPEKKQKVDFCDTEWFFIGE